MLKKTDKLVYPDISVVHPTSAHGRFTLLREGVISCKTGPNNVCSNCVIPKEDLPKAYFGMTLTIQLYTVLFTEYIFYSFSAGQVPAKPCFSVTMTENIGPLFA